MAKNLGSVLTSNLEYAAGKLNRIDRIASPESCEKLYPVFKSPRTSR